MNQIDTYEILVRQHENMLQSYLLGILKNVNLVEEIAQQAFVDAYVNLDTLRDKGAFASWLRTIARNLALQELRKKKRELSIDPQVIQGMEDVFKPLDNTREAESWAERSLAVQTCFEKLPEKLHRTCKLHYMEDEKTNTISKIMSISLSAVLKRLERGRSSVRKCVEKQLKLENV